MIQPVSYHENSTNVRSKMSRSTPPSRVSAPAPSAVLGAKNNGKLPRPLRWLRLGFRTVGVALPGVMGPVAYWLWFRTTRFRARDWELQILERGEKISFGFNGKSLHVRAWGEGPTVLLVHGWNGRGSQMAAFVDPLVEAGYRVLAYDAPGHGRSPGQRSDIFELRDAIESLGEAFGPIHAVIAHSLGVMAFVIATRNGVGTNRAVCLSPGLNLDTFIRMFALTLTLPEKVTRHLRRRLENFVGADFLQDFWQGLQNVPTLVIHDRDDQEIPWQEGQAMAEGLPQGRFTATRGLGHNRILRDSGVIRSAVAFISG